MKKKLLISCIFILGTLLTMRGYQYIYRYEAERIEKKFIDDVHTYANDIEVSLRYDVGAVYSLQAYFKAGGIPTRESFKIFADHLLQKNKSIKAFAWIPRIPEKERESYINDARKDFPSFQILDLTTNEKMVPSPSRPLHYPIYYLEPYKGNESVLGFNHLSNKERREALEKSLDSGDIVVTKPTKVGGDKINRGGFLVYAPFYKKGSSLATVVEKRENNIGFIVGVFVFKDIIDNIKIMLKRNINLIAFDKESPQTTPIFYSSQDSLAKGDVSTRLHHDYEVNIADKSLVLRFFPKPEHYKVVISPIDWALLVLAMMLVTFTSLYLWILENQFEEKTKLNNKFLTLLEAASNAKILIDEQGNVMMINQQAVDLFGYSRAELIGQPYPQLLTTQSYEKIVKAREQLLSGETPTINLKLLILQKIGGKVPVDFQMNPLIETSRENLIVCTFIDLRKIKNLQKQVVQGAYFDQLTKLPNRKNFEETLKKEISKGGRNSLAFLLFIGLDQFKDINDSLGYLVGDALLKSIAIRIRKFVRQEDFIARIGGDEFVVFTTKHTSSKEAQLMAEQLLRAFEVPFRVFGKAVKITASIGISTLPKEGKDMSDLIKQADIAMYQVKNEGGNSHKIFHTGEDVIYRRKYELEAALEFALKHQEFYLEYQPIVEIPSQKIVGVEALLRWNHPIFGFVEPQEFIPLIEYKPLIVNVGRWVFETACQELSNVNDLYVSINLSPRQAQDKKHIQRLIDFCKTEKIFPQRIIIEITESAFMKRNRKSEILLKDLAKAGFSIAIDDFGTEYSSLGRITNLSLSYLKIDKSFVDGIGKNDSDQFIIKSILDLAKSLDLKVIAEGVETKEQLNFLAKNNCSYIQGFYFSKPLSFVELIKILHKTPGK